MPVSDEVGGLPTLLAFDATTVLKGQRRGASIQLDETYFQAQIEAIDALERPDTLERRRAIADESLQRFVALTVDLDDLSRHTLESTSVDLHRVLRDLPEVQYLRAQFPGRVFVVPTWLRAEGRVEYGARVYFLREDDPLEPKEIVHQNIEAVLSQDDASFEAYLGDLHGYPACCVEYFSDQDRAAGPPPEVTATEVIAEHFDSETLSAKSVTPVSIRDIVDGLFESPDVYAFFTREFFPEPGCTTARRLGTRIFDLLTGAYPTPLVKDFFRMNAAWSYLMAQALRADGDGGSRPQPGSLGHEHHEFYLPLTAASELSAYRPD